MKGPGLFTLLSAIGIAILPGSGVAQQKSLEDQLIGSWRLTSWEQVHPDGTKIQRFGADPRGITVFDDTGRVVVMFARPDLPKLAANNPLNPSPGEAKAVVSGTIAYFGTYTVDETARVMSVQVESSTYANQVGEEQRRSITSLTADEMKFTNLNPTSGGQINITMKRLQPGAMN
jgi:hypothetical protein